MAKWTFWAIFWLIHFIKSFLLALQLLFFSGLGRSCHAVNVRIGINVVFCISKRWITFKSIQCAHRVITAMVRAISFVADSSCLDVACLTFLDISADLPLQVWIIWHVVTCQFGHTLLPVGEYQVHVRKSSHAPGQLPDSYNVSQSMTWLLLLYLSFFGWFETLLSVGWWQLLLLTLLWWYRDLYAPIHERETMLQVLTVLVWFVLGLFRLSV